MGDHNTLRYPSITKYNYNEGKKISTYNYYCNSVRMYRSPNLQHIIHNTQRRKEKQQAILKEGREGSQRRSDVVCDSAYGWTLVLRIDDIRTWDRGKDVLGLANLFGTKRV